MLPGSPWVATRCSRLPAHSPIRPEPVGLQELHQAARAPVGESEDHAMLHAMLGRILGHASEDREPAFDGRTDRHERTSRRFQSLAASFLQHHVHPDAIDGRTLMQLVDEPRAIRIDLFHALGSTLSRAVTLDDETGELKVLSVEDLVARTTVLVCGRLRRG